MHQSQIKTKKRKKAAKKMNKDEINLLRMMDRSIRRFHDNGGKIEEVFVHKLKSSSDHLKGNESFNEFFIKLSILERSFEEAKAKAAETVSEAAEPEVDIAPTVNQNDHSQEQSDEVNKIEGKSKIAIEVAAPSFLQKKPSKKIKVSDVRRRLRGVSDSESDLKDELDRDKEIKEVLTADTAKLVEQLKQSSLQVQKTVENESQLMSEVSNIMEKSLEVVDSALEKMDQLFNNSTFGWKFYLYLVGYVTATWIGMLIFMTIT